MARRFRTAAAVAAAAAIAAAPIGAPALAQSQGGEPIPEAEAEAGQAFTEQKLEAYVTAALEVSAIVEEMRPDMEAAQSSGEAAEVEEVRTQLSQRLATAVEGVEGITVDEYQRITRAARGDEDLLNRIRSIASERQEG